MAETTTIAITESNPHRWTEFFAVLSFLVTALAAILGGLNGAGVGKIFGNSVGNISNKYFTEVTPSSYVFATIWPIIFLWTISGSLYLVITIFLAKERSPLKMNPAITPLLYFVFYTVAFAATNCWYFAFDRENLDWSFILLAVAAISTYAAIMITLKRTSDHMDFLRITRSKTTLWLVRIVVQNGLCVFAAWITIATALGFTIVSAYESSPDLPFAMPIGSPSVASASTLSLSVLLVIVVGWFFMENFILEKYFRFIFTIYPVFIFAFSGLVEKLSKSNGTNRNNLVLAAVNLSISINMFVLRVILSLRRLHSARQTKAVVVAT